MHVIHKQPIEGHLDRFCILLSSGCGNRFAANETNFTRAIKDSVGYDGNFCLTDPELKWPTDFIPGSGVAFDGHATREQMEAFRNVGIVDERTVVVEAVRANFCNTYDWKNEPPCISSVSAPFPLHMLRYFLTPKGKSYLQTVTTKGVFEKHPTQKKTLCIGKTQLEIQGWGRLRPQHYDGIGSGYLSRSMVNNTWTTVCYRLWIPDMPDWARSPAVQKAFPLFQKVGDGWVSVWLRANGWVADQQTMSLYRQQMPCKQIVAL